MRKLLSNIMLTTLLILGLSGVGIASTPVNTGKITPSYQKAATGLHSADSGVLQTISYGATVITGVNVTSGATANVVQMWDNNNTVGLGLANNSSNTVLEVGTAANTSTFFDFSQTPIRTVNGLEASGADSTGGSYIVYTVQYP